MPEVEITNLLPELILSPVFLFWSYTLWKAYREKDDQLVDLSKRQVEASLLVKNALENNTRVMNEVLARLER